jgi:hypothetical protein
VENFFNKIDNEYKKNLYVSFFGRQSESDQKILQSQINKLKRLYKKIIMLFFNGTNDAIDSYKEIYNICVELGFEKLTTFFTINKDIIFIIDICERTLSFAGQFLEESKDVLKTINKFKGN